MTDQSQPIRFTSILSDIALSDSGAARPIHMLRPGTFTDMYGTETTFTTEDVYGIAQRYTNLREAPITERHDWGRAIGRLQRLWTDDAGNLYGMPRWNKFGRELLQDEVYNAFSIELMLEDGGWCCVGGSLTNYPAVSDLQPVALSMPPMDEPSTEVIEPLDIPIVLSSQEEHIMPDVADTQQTPPEAPPPVSTPPAQPSQITLSPELMNAFSQLFGDTQQQSAEQLRTLLTQQMQTQWAELQRQSQEAAARQFAAFQAEQRIIQLAQHMTSPTVQRQHALPLEADRLSKFLIGLSSDQRTEALAIFERILTAGLVSFEELGARGGDENTPDPIEQYNQAVNTRVAGGMARANAITAVMNEQPDIYRAYNDARRNGGR